MSTMLQSMNEELMHSVQAVSSAHAKQWNKCQSSIQRLDHQHADVLASLDEHSQLMREDVAQRIHLALADMGEGMHEISAVQRATKADIQVHSS